MKRVGLFLCGTAAVLMAGISGIHAQTGGSALFTYPMQGQTPEQESADRAACHNWAVQQTGFDPSAVFIAQQYGVPQRTINQVTRRVGTPAGGGIGGARGNAEVRRINALYDDYLRAAQVCMEGRGYRVSR
ncbi:MAG: hypothetical protein ACOYB4_02975 [Methyloceanibacter sp.]